MSTIAHDVVDSTGKKVGSFDLLEKVFGATVKPDLVHQVVRWQRAKKRAGTHSVLNRDRMEGGGKKPWKQKGTGNARAGSRNSPVWVGGAVAHGPSPRSYEFSVPKQVRRQALCSALSSKKKDGNLIIIDSITSTGKTKEMQDVLRAVGVEKKGALIVVPELAGEADSLVARASKNLAKVKTVPVIGLNVYDLINADMLVCTKAAIEALQKKASGSKE